MATLPGPCPATGQPLSPLCSALRSSETLSNLLQGTQLKPTLVVSTALLPLRPAPPLFLGQCPAADPEAASSPAACWAQCSGSQSWVWTQEKPQGAWADGVCLQSSPEQPEPPPREETTGAPWEAFKLHTRLGDNQLATLAACPLCLLFLICIRESWALPSRAGSLHRGLAELWVSPWCLKAGPSLARGPTERRQEGWALPPPVFAPASLPRRPAERWHSSPCSEASPGSSFQTRREKQSPEEAVLCWGLRSQAFDLPGSG